MTTEQVQRWVISALICAVASFPVGALIATGVVMDRAGGNGDALALSFMAGVIGLIAVGAARAVHRLRLLSPFVLLGTLPGLAGLAWLLLGAA